MNLRTMRDSDEAVVVQQHLKASQYSAGPVKVVIGVSCTGKVAGG